MNATFERWLVLFVTFLASSACVATAAEPVEAEIARLIKQLGSNDFDVRERASKQLESIGEPIRVALEKAAAESDDEETRERALALLKLLDSKLEVLCYKLHSEMVLGVAFTPDGQKVISASRDGTVRLIDRETGKLVHCFAHPLAFSVAVSADGKRAISGGYGPNQTLRLWDLETGEEIRRYTAYQSSVYGLAFSPDSKQALFGALDQNAAMLLDLESGEIVKRFAGHTGWVVAIALSVDGKRSLSASHDTTVRVWDTATGREVTRFTGHSGLAGAVAISPDGTRAVSGSTERTIKVWDVETGKPIRQMDVPFGSVGHLVFSNDGRRIASANLNDLTVSLWDAETGQELYRYAGHTDQVRSVAISADGRFVASGGFDKTVRVWRVPK
jgi:WD40 repeat protein